MNKLILQPRVVPRVDHDQHEVSEKHVVAYGILSRSEREGVSKRIHTERERQPAVLVPCRSHASPSSCMSAV